MTPFLLAFATLTLIMSVVAFCAFALDKRAAVLGHRRTRERTLHLLEFLGGWPGALAAIFIIRHKTRDGPFLFLTGLSTALHAVLWLLGLWLWLFPA
ncbi:MAG: DUF1294 domain-containing protein [Phycisphaerales bacterium]